MSRLNPSFITELKNAISTSNFSAKDFIVNDYSSGKTLINIQFKYNDHYDFEITEEKLVETVTEKGPFSTSITGTSERKNTSIENYAVYSPGKYKNTDKIKLYNLGSATESIRDWCDFIYSEISHQKDDETMFDDLREQIEEQLKSSGTNESEPFNSEEIDRINKKFDELLSNFELLKTENKITQDELNKVKDELSSFKSTAKVLPKGLWARITNNKLVDIAVKFAKTKEGKDFIISQIKRLVE
ncbi:MAG: hypothetical protein ACTH36_09655 [Pseudoalteromonas nigrifaciens]